MMPSVEQCKESISDRYIQDFKKQLGFFDTILVAPIFTKMKDILKSDKKIDVDNLKDLEELGFWRNILGVKFGEKQLFENLVNKTFNFLKEKQEKILQAQTEGRLDELLNLVINGKLDVLDQRLDDTNDNQEGGENNQEGGENNQEGGENNQEGGENNQEGGENNQEGGENNQEGGENNQEGGENNQEGGENNQEGGENNQEGGENNQEGGENTERNDEGIDPVGAGTATAAAGGAVYKGISEAEKKLGINKLKNVPEEFDAKRTKKMLEDLSGQMDEKLNSGVKMSRAQKRVYEKSIKEFNKAAQSLDKETEEAFKAWQKLQDRMPYNLLKTLNVDRKILQSIEALPDEELVKIIGKDEKFIINFFKGKNIKISEDLAKQLKVVKNVSEIKGLTKILKNGTKLANVLKGIKGMGVVTFLFIGFDVWAYFESNKEAELVSKINEVRGTVLKDKATMQLLIGVGTVVAEALGLWLTCVATGSATGPRGTAIGIIVGIIAVAASFLYDELYADKKEFYAQNRYDFINKKRTEIKQSIVQLFESDRLDMHESMKQSIKDDRGPNSEIDTMEDAWEALIYQEEIMERGFYQLQLYYSSGESEGAYIEKLNKEDKKQYEEEKKQMESIINLRMEYIKQYVKEDKNSKEYNEMKKALSENKGLEYVEQLLADSKVYAYLKSDNEDAYVQNYKELSVNEYKEAFKQKLSQEYSQEFAIFEKLRQENPSHLQELCEGVSLHKGTIEIQIENEEGEHCYSEQEKIILKKNIDFVVKYNEYLNLGRSMEKQISTGVSGDSIDYEYIEQVLLDLNSINKRPVWDKDFAMKYLSLYEFDDNIESIDSQVSNSTFQNVVYSIAREIHGYTGKNDKGDLIGFYSCDGDSTGIYMDGKRKIKDVSGFFGTKDRSIDEPDKLTKDEALKMIVGEVDLDSTVEAADDKLTGEFRKRVKMIVDREYAYRENKKDYEKQIVDFIKTNNSGQDGYVGIPEHLVIKAKKAGIGDINKFLFRIEGGQIYALCRGDMANTVLHFDDANIKIKYEALNPLRSELTQQEKELASYVDDMEKKLNKLRSKQGQFLFRKGHEDDLDIPVEIERIISQKSIEWDNLKKSLLYMQPYTAHDCLAEKSKEYYDFFNGIYLGILNRVTTMNHVMGMNSNDIDTSSDFLYALQFIGFNVAFVKDGKLEINELISEAIKKHLPDLFDSYKESSTGKTVKELLMDEENETNQKKGQEIAKKIYELCLEQAVLTFDEAGSVKSISSLDFSDNDLEKVKEKLRAGLSGLGFQTACDEYQHADRKFNFTTTIRSIEQAEVDANKEIEDMTQKIIGTMNDVDRANKRKDPKWESDAEQKEEGKITGIFRSRGYSEKITINMDDSKNIKSITIDGLGITFPSAQEGFCTANLINFIHDNAKENPRGSDAPGGIGHLEYYHWSTGGDLERDVRVDMGVGNVDSPADVDIVDTKTMDEYFKTIHNNESFLRYINKFL